MRPCPRTPRPIPPWSSPRRRSRERSRVWPDWPPCCGAGAEKSSINGPLSFFRPRWTKEAPAGVCRGASHGRKRKRRRIATSRRALHGSARLQAPLFLNSSSKLGPGFQLLKHLPDSSSGATKRRFASAVDSRAPGPYPAQTDGRCPDARLPRHWNRH